MRSRFPALTGGVLLVVLAACEDNPSGPAETGSVQLSPSQVELQVGESRQFVVVVRDTRGRVVTDAEVTWSVEHEAFATVDAVGGVTGVAQGGTFVTASVDGREGTATVTVVPPPVESVDVDPPEVVMEEGDTLSLTATPRDAEGEPIAGLFTHWTSSDEDVAVVDPLGRVTGIRHGSATITARVHGRSREITMTVVADYDFDLVFDRWGGADAPQLFLLDLAGGSPVQIVPAGLGEGATATQGAPSPDGSRIAFTSVVGSGTEIFVVDRDGGGLVQLTGEGHFSAQPAWSPDGARIAYTSWPSGSDADIWLVDPDGGNKENLTADQEGGHSAPDWSPDGTRIAYSRSHAGLGHLWTMDSDGGDKEQVTDPDDAYDDQPSWSPDGTTIAFHRAGVGNQDIWLVDASGAEERVLVSAALHQRAPAWSPDGRLVAFVSGHRDGEESVYTVRADGTTLARRSWGLPQDAHPAWILRPPEE